MDPRHPELAVSRLKELIKQYDRIENDIKNATVSSRLGQLEREGGLVVQEMCLVAPRIHEALMQVSRQRRHQLSMGITYIPEEKVGKYTKATIGITGEEDVKEITVTPVEAVAIVEDLELVSTEVKDSDDKTSFEVEQVYRPKKKSGRKKKAE